MAAIGRAFENFATTAAFALPNPWGVLGSGLLGVVFMFTGKEDKQKNPLIDALEDAVKQIGRIIRDQAKGERIHNAALGVQEALDWITEKWEILKELDDERNKGSSFVQDLLAKLNAVDMPDNPVKRAIDEMDDIINDETSDLALQDAALEVMLNAVSAYLTYLRLRVQLKSWQDLDSGDDLFYAWYDQFIRQTGVQIDKVENDLNALANATLIALSKQGVSSDKQGEMVDEKYEHVTQGVATWQNNAEAWSDNKPPRVPSKAPRVSSKPEDWAATTPRGDHWLKGANVRYAVGFKNSNAGTPPGPWTDWVTVTDHAYPTLTDLPIDPLGIAKSRVIYRQFEGQEKTKVGIITDNSTATYQDKND